MQPIVFVVCTKRSQTDFITAPFYKFQSKVQSPDIIYEIFYENAQGLPKCYNQAIQKYRHLSPIMVFTHDDACIADLFWEEKLRNSFKKAPIIGVAGAVKYDIHAADAGAWPQRSCPQQQLLGYVNHPMGACYVPSVFGLEGHAQIMDGLLIALDLSCPELSKISWDESFEFHFYDLDLCMQANTAGIRMYVTLLNIEHDSHGSYGNAAWTSTLAKYYRKWRQAEAGNTLIDMST